MSTNTAKRLSRLRRMCESGAALMIRESAGVSLAEVAEPVDVARSTISRWERSLSVPRGERALRYLDLLEELASP
jgi:DNA-binding transcriptional regulator YiaG